MRIGANPAKSSLLTRSDAEIRVVVPVYIPDLSGYFADAAVILEMCLDSLAATAGAETRITVVANACTADVLESLGDRQRAGLIDQLIVSHDNLGKVDGFLAGARSSWEPVVVVSDADVLWRSGWQVAVTAILAAFPECGLVGAAPAPNLALATPVTVLGGLLRREISRRPMVELEDLDRFAASVGNPDLFAGHETDQLVVERDGTAALVGGGHFASAMRRAALADVAPGPCLGPEHESFDRPIEAAGWWRLASPRAHALHLGNVVEPWMAGELEAQGAAPARIAVKAVPAGRPSRLGTVPVGVRDRLAARAVRRVTGS